MRETNCFENISMVYSGPSTNNIDRKAKKKLREIAKLEQKDVKTEDELEKIKEKPYWEAVLNPNKDDCMQSTLQKISKKHKRIIIRQTEEDLTKSKYSDSCCPCCMEEMDGKTQIETNCKHHVCYKCFEKLLDISDSLPCCPLCRAKVTIINVQKENLSASFSKKLLQQQSVHHWVTLDWRMIMHI